jgi:hypothetical protein
MEEIMSFLSEDLNSATSIGIGALLSEINRFKAASTSCPTAKIKEI